MSGENNSVVHENSEYETKRIEEGNASLFYPNQFHYVRFLQEETAKIHAWFASVDSTRAFFADTFPTDDEVEQLRQSSLVDCVQELKDDYPLLETYQQKMLSEFVKVIEKPCWDLCLYLLRQGKETKSSNAYNLGYRYVMWREGESWFIAGSSSDQDAISVYDITDCYDHFLSGFHPRFEPSYFSDIKPMTHDQMREHNVDPVVLKKIRINIAGTVNDNLEDRSVEILQQHIDRLEKLIQDIHSNAAAVGVGFNSQSVVTKNPDIQTVVGCCRMK